MGVSIKVDGSNAYIQGVGKYGFKKPKVALDCGNSATTMRLLSGVLVGQDFSTTLIGDNSLMNRPMERIISPLSEMGGILKEKKEIPLEIKPTNKLKGIEYKLPIASAK